MVIPPQVAYVHGIETEDVHLRRIDIIQVKQEIVNPFVKVAQKLGGTAKYFQLFRGQARCKIMVKITIPKFIQKLLKASIFSSVSHEVM